MVCFKLSQNLKKLINYAAKQHNVVPTYKVVTLSFISYTKKGDTVVHWPKEKQNWFTCTISKLNCSAYYHCKYMY